LNSAKRSTGCRIRRCWRTVRHSSRLISIPRHRDILPLSGTELFNQLLHVYANTFIVRLSRRRRVRVTIAGIVRSRCQSSRVNRKYSASTSGRDKCPFRSVSFRFARFRPKLSRKIQHVCPCTSRASHTVSKIRLEQNTSGTDRAHRRFKTRAVSRKRLGKREWKKPFGSDLNNNDA